MDPGEMTFKMSEGGGERGLRVSLRVLGAQRSARLAVVSRRPVGQGRRVWPQIRVKIASRRRNYQLVKGCGRCPHRRGGVCVGAGEQGVPNPRAFPSLSQDVNSGWASLGMRWPGMRHLSRWAPSPRRRACGRKSSRS